LNQSSRRTAIPSPNRQPDVIILGAGAAGLLCALEAGQRGRRVLLLDHADRVGRKILISGGGRCNFTNLDTDPSRFLSANPHFAKSALARYTPSDFIALVRKHRIAYHEKTLGQLFCDGSAQAIVSMLMAECEAVGVETLLRAAVTEISRSERFHLETSFGRLSTPALVIATGGLSIPKMGATSFGYDTAAHFGLKLTERKPGLVPFVLTAAEQAAWCDLSGLSAEVEASAGTGPRRGSFIEKMLLTHRGLSGPAILQASSFWAPGQPISLDLAPGKKVFGSLRASPSGRGEAAALAALRSLLPARLAERWLAHHATGGWTNSAVDALEAQLHAWQLTPEGTEGYAKAEVTVGGVDTSELDARTLQSKHVPGLFFIGEVVDVTGWLGGYNFQWAWASGAAAGRAV
jgi:predicted Rossmann fold flavoprotein